MATFPTLKTGAVAQYPAQRRLQFQNQALRFVDGSEQRYQDSASALHQWVIQLSLLDEGEMAAIENFFLANQGRSLSFAFTDPWDGAAYPTCQLGSDSAALTSIDTMKGKTTLTIVEVRT
jgi:hypothetical protein